MLLSILSVTNFVSTANAQAVTIKTSGDAFGGTFYGESFLEVVIVNPYADDDDVIETLSVDIDVTPESGSGGSTTVSVPETSESSGKFELFLVHEDADNIDETALDPLATTPFVVSFGPDGAASGGITADDTITADVTMGDEDASIDITAGDEDVTVTYEQMDGQLTLDRDTPYGSQALMHVFITDQDSNNDPTHSDSFTVIAADMAGIDSSALFKLTGGTFPDDVTFDETGDNTAKFEAVLQLTNVDTLNDDELVTTAESLTLTLFDHADYGDITDVDGDVVEDSTSTDDQSIEVDDVDGDVSDIASLTFGSEIKPTVTDTDRNLDSEIKDDIPGALVVQLDNAGGDSEHVDLEETGKNTGVFQIDLANGELRVTFLPDDEDPIENDGVLELRHEDISKDIIVSYTDPTDDDGQQSLVSQFVISLDLVNGTIGLPDAVSTEDSSNGTSTGTFALFLFDPDLNDNKRTKDSYTINLEGASPFPLSRGGSTFGEIGQFGISIAGNDLNFGTPIAITLTETAIASGNFTAVLSIDDFLASAGTTVKDGDVIVISYDDLMSGTESSDSMIIGKAPYSLNLFEGENATDGTITVTDSIRAVATTNDPNVTEVTFTWTGRNPNIVPTRTVPVVAGQAEDTLNPYQDIGPDIGEFSVMADFGNGETIVKTFNISFFVIPESPIGVIALMGAAFAALGGFVYLKKRHTSNSNALPY